MRSVRAFGAVVGLGLSLSFALSAQAQDPVPDPSGQPPPPSPIPTLPPIPGLPPFTSPPPPPPPPPPPAQPGQYQQPAPAPTPTFPTIPGLPPPFGPAQPQPPVQQPAPYGQQPCVQQPYGPPCPPQQPYPYGQQPAPYGQQPLPGQPCIQQPGGPPCPVQTPPPYTGPRDRSGAEMGLLYATTAAWGVSAGVWIDLEAGVTNPGAALIAPVVLGVAAPTTMFFLDRPKMREGRPAAISAGILFGAGENALIFARQYVTAPAGQEWGATQYFRGNVIASTVGGVGGFLAHYGLKFNTRTTAFASSGAVWGSLIGAAFGGAASSGTWENTTNDSVFLGSLIGYNVAFAGAVGASAFWNPSWNQIAWMWGGFGAGAAISALIYPFYALTDADPRTGLYAQGIVAPLGALVGALVGSPEPASGSTSAEVEDTRHFKFARVLGPTILPVRNGAGVQLVGELY